MGGIFSGMSGFGNSQKSNSNSNTDYDYSQDYSAPVTTDGGSSAINALGASGNVFNLTDGGAVSGALDFSNNVQGNAFEFGAGTVNFAGDALTKSLESSNISLGNAFEFGAGTVNFAGDALTKSLGASSDSFNASLGFSNDVFTKALDTVNGANSVSTDAFNTSVGFGSKSLDFADVALGDAFRFGAGSINFAGDALTKSLTSSNDAVNLSLTASNDALSQSLAASADSQQRALAGVSNMANSAFSVVAANDAMLGRSYDKLLLSTGESLGNILDSVKTSQSFVSDAQATAKGALDSRTITILALGLGAVALFLIKR